MNIGFVVNNLSNSELAYDLLKTLHDRSGNSNDEAYYIFYQNITPPVMSLPCLGMNITGLSNFTGKAIALNIDSANVLMSNNSPTENYLYLWDIPWLGGVINYQACVELLKRFKIFVRSESHKKNVMNFTGRNDIVVAENINEVLKCLT